MIPTYKFLSRWRQFIFYERKKRFQKDIAKHNLAKTQRYILGGVGTCMW